MVLPVLQLGVSKQPGKGLQLLDPFLQRKKQAKKQTKNHESLLHKTCFLWYVSKMQNSLKIKHTTEEIFFFFFSWMVTAISYGEKAPPCTEAETTSSIKLHVSYNRWINLLLISLFKMPWICSISFILASSYKKKKKKKIH